MVEENERDEDRRAVLLHTLAQKGVRVGRGIVTLHQIAVLAVAARAPDEGGLGTRGIQIDRNRRVLEVEVQRTRHGGMLDGCQRGFGHLAAEEEAPLVGLCRVAVAGGVAIENGQREGTRKAASSTHLVSLGDTMDRQQQRRQRCYKLNTNDR